MVLKQDNNTTEYIYKLMLKPTLGPINEVDRVTT